MLVSRYNHSHSGEGDWDQFCYFSFDENVGDSDTFNVETIL